MTWTTVATLDPNALSMVTTRLSTPMNLRYLRVRHQVQEEDWAKVYVWEIQAYDQYGPYGPPPTPAVNPHSMAELLGVDGIWGWGTNQYSDDLGSDRGPQLYTRVAASARNYHNMSWDVTDPDHVPDYDAMAAGHGTEAQWWLNWDREYGAWVQAGLPVDASIQFIKDVFPPEVWDDPYIAGYNYGYAFARHFGPTHGTGHVRVMEVGNEPWHYSADFYRQVLHGMAQGAKTADPALIVLPAAFQADTPEAPDASEGNYLGARVTADEAPYLDGLNAHVYSFATLPDGARVAVPPEHPESGMHALRNILRFRDANMPGKPVYVTEWGWDSTGAGEVCNASECVSEEAQALYAVRGALMLAREGADRLDWFFYANDKNCDTLFCRSGLTGSVNTGFALKRSFTALEALTDTLGDRHFVSALREDDEAWVYLLGDADGTPTHLVAWRPVDAADTSVVTVTVPVNGIPGRAWHLGGLSAHGEPVATPGINPATGDWLLPLTATPLVATIEPQEKGMSYATWWSGNYASSGSDLSLGHLADTGATWISLIVTGYQDDLTSTDIYTNTATPTDADLIHAIQRAHSLGLKVMLKPHVDLWNDPAHWRGQITFGDEAQWQAWFASYRSFIDHYADLAKAQGVEQFCVGTELSGTAQREADWRAVIADVRSRYHGPIIYAANQGGEETGITWWDAVDYIGVDAYYSLTEEDDPTLAELEAGWDGPLVTLSALAATWNKPILFPEIGYRSIDGANRDPWNWQRSGALDLQEQAEAYQAFFDRVWSQPWFGGVFWWMWETDPFAGGPCDTGYTPYDKPAEAVLRTGYDGAPLPTPAALLPDDDNARGIYDEGLAAGWDDWSWSATRDLAATDQVYSGTQAISVTLGTWGGLSFWHSAFPADAYTWLELYLRPGQGDTHPLEAFFYDDSGQELFKRHLDDCRYVEGGTLQPDAWNRVLIPLEHLGVSGHQVARITIQNDSTQPVSFWVDAIRLVGSRACPDLDGDGQVGASDLALVAGRWHDPASDIPAYDLHPDGVIDVLDVLTLGRDAGRACIFLRP